MLGSQPVGKVKNHLQAECRECTAELVAALCRDGEDNDEDWLVDCQDPDCKDLSTCSAVEGPENTSVACADGFDNDGNGYTDCKDFDCIKNADVCCTKTGPETTNATCHDGLDNDCNAYADCDDHSCSQDNRAVTCP